MGSVRKRLRSSECAKMNENIHPLFQSILDEIYSGKYSYLPEKAQAVIEPQVLSGDDGKLLERLLNGEEE